MRRPTMAAAALLMGAAVLGSRLLGYVRDAYVAFAFGAGPATDAYVAAFTLPDYLNYALAGGALSITFIPIYTGLLQRGREGEGARVVHVVLTVMGLLVCAGVAAGWVLAPRFVPLIVPDFGPEQIALCVRLTRILLPAQIFFYTGGIVMATLLARKRFLAPAVAPMIYNLGIILGGVLLGPVLGVEGLAWGALGGAVAGPFLVPLLVARRVFVKAGQSLFRPRFAPLDPAFREWIRLSIPLMIGFSLTTADEWIMRYFASGVDGAIFRINLARRLLLVPVAVIGQAAGQATLPFFASLFAERKRDELVASIRSALGAVWLIGALAAAGLIAVAYPAVDLLYRRGGFSVLDARQTAAIVTAFAIGVPFWCAQAVLARAFYAAKDTWKPMLVGTAVTLASVPLFGVGWRWHGTLGLAAAAALGMSVHAATLGLLLRRRFADSIPASLVTDGARAVALAAVCGLAAWGAEWAVSGVLPPGYWRSGLQLAVGCGAFGLTALLGARLLGIRAVFELIGRLVRRRARDDEG